MLLFHSDGRFSPNKPTYTENKTAQGTQIHITARTSQEAHEMLKGIQRKHPEINPEDLLKTMQRRSVYLESPIRFQTFLGGDGSSRSTIKTIMAFAHSVAIPKKYCESGRAYLCSMADHPDISYYYDRDLIIERPKGVPLHCVALSGDPETGVLLAYVEYFGFHRIVVRLSTQYYDVPLNRSFTMNPVTGKEINVIVNLKFSAEELSSILGNKTITEISIQKCVDDVIQYRLVETFNNEKEKMIRDATLYAFENCGAKEGDVLTLEHVRIISRITAERVVPFIMANAKMNRN